MVLETITLPIELQPYAPSPVVKIPDKGGKKAGAGLEPATLEVYKPQTLAIWATRPWRPLRACDSVWDGGDQRYAVLVRVTSRSSPNSHNISIHDLQVSLGNLL